MAFTATKGFCKIRFGQIDKTSSPCLTRLLTKEEYEHYGIDPTALKRGKPEKNPSGKKKYKRNRVMF